MPLRLIPHVHRATHRIGLYIGRLPEPGVTQGEAHILAHLASEGAVTVAALHRAFAHRRSTLTSILDRLEARGVIERTTDARDRRSFVVSLTSSGRPLARRVAAHLERLEADALAGVSARDLQRLQTMLEGLEHAAGRTTDRVLRRSARRSPGRAVPKTGRRAKGERQRAEGR